MLNYVYYTHENLVLQYFYLRKIKETISIHGIFVMEGGSRDRGSDRDSLLFFSLHSSLL